MHFSMAPCNVNHSFIILFLISPFVLFGHHSWVAADISDSISPLPPNWTAQCLQAGDGQFGFMTTFFAASAGFGFGCQPWTSPGAFYITVAYALGSYGSTPVWVANPHRPVGVNASLQLDSKGDVLLRDADGSLVWAANATGVKGIRLESSGNLIFVNGLNATVWQSFDHPADLILRGQTMRPGTKLVAGFSSGVSATGSYSAVMEPGGLVLYEDSSSTPLPYYVFGFRSDPGTLKQALHGPCRHTILELSSDGSTLLQKQAVLTSKCNDSGEMGTTFGPSFESVTVDYLRLDADGDVRGYSFTYKFWSVTFDWFKSNSLGSCHLPGICGPYGICSSVDSQCSCPRNSLGVEVFLPVNSSIPSLGCVAPRPLNCQHGKDSQYFLELKGADYFPNDALLAQKNSTTVEDCKKSCAADCSCAAAFYRKKSRACFHYENVKSIVQTFDTGHLAFLKVQK